MSNSTRKQKDQPNRKKSTLRQIISISFRATVVVFLGFFIMVLLLHIPAVQNKTVKLALETVAEKIDKRIECEYFHLALPGTLEIRNLRVYHNPAFGSEPLGSVEYLYAVFNPLSVTDDRFHVRELTLKNTEFRIIYTPDKKSNLHRDDYVRKSKKRERNGDDSKFRDVFNRFQVDHISLNQVYFELDYTPSDYYLEVPLFNFEGKWDPDENVLKTKLSGYCVKNYIPGKLDSLADAEIYGDVWAGGVRNGLIQVTANSGQFWLQGLCQLDNFYMPTLDFVGSSVVNLLEIPPLAQVDTHLAGDTALTFKGKGLAEDLLISANFVGKQIEFNKFNIAEIRGNASYCDENITITDSRGAAYSGQITGDGSVRFKKDDKHIDINATINNANLAALCSDLKVPFLLESDCDTTLSITGDGFKTTDLIISGHATGMEKLSTAIHDPFKLTGDFQMIAGSFTIPQGTLVSADHSITLQNGVFDRSCLSGEITGLTDNINDLILTGSSVYGKSFPIPDIHGSGRFNVNLDGSLENYTVTTVFTGDSIQYNGLPPGTLEATAVVQPGLVDISSTYLDFPDMNVAGNLEIAIPMAQDSDIALQSAHLDIKKLRLSALDAIVKRPLQLSGVARGKLLINSNQSPADDDIGSNLTITDTICYDLPLNTVEVQADVSTSGISNISAKANPDNGQLNVSGNVPFNGSPDLVITGDNLHYGIVPLFAMLEPDGVFSLELHSETSDDAMNQLFFTVAGDRLHLGGIDTGRLMVSGSIILGDYPEISWTADWNESMLHSTGRVSLDSGLNSEIYGTLTEFPLSVPVGIAAVFSDTRLPLTGHLTGESTVRGPLRHFTDVKTRIDISEMVADYSGSRMNLSHPTLLTMLNNRITIAETTLIGKNAEITSQGYLETNGGVKLGMAGNLNLDSLETYTGFIDSTSGNMVLDIDLTGLWRDPEFSGSVFIEEFYGYIPSFDVWLEDYHSEIVLDQKIGKLMYLEGIAGGSYMGGEGEIGFTRFIPDLFDLSLAGDDIDFEYPRGFDSQANLTLGITGKLPAVNITGDINLRQCNYTDRINYKTMIVNESRAKLSLGDNKKQARPDTVSTAFNPRFGLSITGQDNLFIDNNLARVEMSVKLDVLGSLSKPQILGHIDVLRGDVTFMQRSFELINASIDFADPNRIDPLISVQAGADIDDYRVTLDVSGQLYSAINIQPSSSPPLNDLDLWNLMLIGKTRDSMASTSDDYLASGVAYVTGSLQEQIEQRFEYWMGFDEFSIDPIMSSSDESPSAKFTVKKRFGPDLSVVYSRSASSNGDLLLIEYEVSDNLYILGQKSEDNAVGIDLRYRWEFE